MPKPDEVKWGNYPRYRYAYTDSKIGTAYFEIINYAGGVIHHSRFRNEDSTELLKHFIDHNVDGIIVLVSAPKEGQEQSDIPDEIATIQAAVFSFIKGEGSAQHRYPVALALTKRDRQWERGVPIPPNDADVEAERLARFMEQHTAYQEVCDLLKRSADGNFKTFPVSALGLCSNDDKPCKMPLESYGLPFVFHWLIQSTNDADFRRFETLQSELPWWQVLPLIPRVLAKYTPAWEKWTQPVQETWTLGKSLLNRLPETKEGEEKRTVVRASQKRLMTIWRTQLAGTIIITALLVFAIGIGVTTRKSDARIITEVETIINDPASTLQDLERVEPRLNRVVQSSSYTVPFHGRGKERKQVSQNLLERIQNKHEEIVLTPFHAIPIDDNERIQELGQAYFDRFPNGKMREEVLAKMTEAQNFLIATRAENQFTEIINVPKENNDNIQALGRQYLDEFPTGKHREKVIEIMNDAQRLHEEAIARRSSEETVREMIDTLDKINDSIKRSSPSWMRWLDFL